MKPVPVFVAKPPIRALQAKAGADDRSLLTINETAKKCRCSRRHIQQQIADGHLRVVKLGKRMTRIDPRDLAEFLHERKRGGTRPVDGPAQNEHGGAP